MGVMGFVIVGMNRRSGRVSLSISIIVGTTGIIMGTGVREGGLMMSFIFRGELYRAESEDRRGAGRKEETWDNSYLMVDGYLQQQAEILRRAIISSFCVFFFFFLFLAGAIGRGRSYRSHVRVVWLFPIYREKLVDITFSV